MLNNRKRRRARVLFWRGRNEQQIAHRLDITPQQVRRILFARVLFAKTNLPSQGQ